MATVIVVGQQQAPTDWNNDFCDCCGAPGGFCTFLYACFCPFCAAGDVAQEAGKDYCCSCCIPILIASMIPITKGFSCCIWDGDRKSLTQRYNVLDPLSGSACCLFCLCCHSCLLAQELNHITAYRSKLGQGSTVVVTQQMPQQQVMGGGYPQGFAPPPPQGAYPQQGGYPQGFPPPPPMPQGGYTQQQGYPQQGFPPPPPPPMPQGGFAPQQGFPPPPPPPPMGVYPQK